MRDLPQCLLWILFRQHKIEKQQEDIHPDSLLPTLQLVEKCEPERMEFGMRVGAKLPWTALEPKSMTFLRKEVSCDFFIVSGHQQRLWNDDKSKCCWKKTSCSLGDARSHGIKVRCCHPGWRRKYRLETAVLKPSCPLEPPVEFKTPVTPEPNSWLIVSELLQVESLPG